MKRTFEHPDRITSYFREEWVPLLWVTISGIFYNIGLLAGPWFEGQLAQCLMEVFGGEKGFSDMLQLAVLYVAVIGAVQLARYVKRRDVRHFANNVNRRMKHVLYGNLIHMSKARLDRENIGSMMTKAIADVDACAEGMRKVTTEIFDTGVALAAYAGLLLWYDWRLALSCLAFLPFSYLMAGRMKKRVQTSGAAFKESAGRLNAATLDRVAGAQTYRVFGCEPQIDAKYEAALGDYERKAVKADIWVSALPPLYRVISLMGTVLILYFGARNVAGVGWSHWDIAAFTTFLSCFLKLSTKSSKAAKLFNSVQKAEVSWKRIKPLMKAVPEETLVVPGQPGRLEVKALGFAYPGAKPVFEGLSFAAEPGQIIGVTGPVACGKSTFGRTFLCEYPYQGSIRFDGEELETLREEERCGIVGYLGHDPELMSDTIRNNLFLGEDGDPEPFLRAVCFDAEVAAMPLGAQTRVGSGGVRLSGGQQARLALARTLAHPKPLLVLDDPFAALDRQTEGMVFANLKELTRDTVVILISHRLYLFPEADQVIWMEDGHAEVGTHDELMRTNSRYAGLYQAQCEGGEKDEA